MPPGKDRENLHVSLPVEMKNRLVDESKRRNISASDLVVEYIHRATKQEEQWRLDLQRILELNSQKSDRILAQVESVVSRLSTLQRVDHPVPEDDKFHYRKGPWNEESPTPKEDPIEVIEKPSLWERLRGHP